jgi:hypothetical protein
MPKSFREFPMRSKVNDSRGLHTKQKTEQGCGGNFYTGSDYPKFEFFQNSSFPFDVKYNLTFLICKEKNDSSWDWRKDSFPMAEMTVVVKLGYQDVKLWVSRWMH